MLIETVWTLLSVAVAYAAPVAKGGGNKVHLVRSTLPVDGPSTYLQGLSKHGSSSPLLKRGTADISANFTPSGGEYQAPITIGGQEFLVIFDTGSPDLWVFSVETEDAPPGFPLYDPALSTTAVRTQGTFNISYGDNSSSYGDVYLDTINIGGIVIENQAVESPLFVGGKFLQTGSDGILGLSPGPNTIVPAGVPTTLQNLAGSGELTSLLFTSALTRPGEFQPFYTFGYIDQNLLAGQTPEYTPIIPTSQYWEFPSEYAIINGERISRPSGNTAFADTGTTMIYLGVDIVAAIYEPMGGVYDASVPGWLIPSAISLDQITKVTLPAGNAEITLQPEDLVFAPVNDSWVLGSIQPGDQASPDVFGQYWLRNTYSIWDFGATTAGVQFGVVQRLPSSP